MRRTLACILALLGLLLTIPARAEIDPRLAAAIDRWLDDDDAGSLPVMAELARAGDPDARLLLGGISFNIIPTKYFSGPRGKERFEDIFSQDGRRSVSWLKVEAERQPIAAALLGISSTPTAMISARQLVELGELRAAAIGLMHPIDVIPDNPDLIRMATTGPFPPSVRHLAWTVAYHHPDVPGASQLLLEARESVRRRELQGLWFLVALFGTGVDDDFVQVNRYWYLRKDGRRETPMDPYRPGLLAHMIATAPETATIRALCARVCADEQPACGVAVLSWIRSVNGLVWYRPPVEKIISAERYDVSMKAQNNMLRTVQHSFDEKVPEGFRPPQCLRDERLPLRFWDRWKELSGDRQ